MHLALRLVAEAARRYRRDPRIALLAIPGLLWYLPYPHELLFQIARVPTLAFVSLMSTTALSHAFYESGQGREWRILAPFLLAIRRSAALATIFVRELFGVLLPFVSVVGIPLGVYIAVRWWFASILVGFSDITGCSALRMSGDLVQGRWWSTFGRIVFVTAVTALPVLMLTIVLRSFSSTLVVIPAGLSVVAAPFVIGYYTLLALELIRDSENPVVKLDQSARP